PEPEILDDPSIRDDESDPQVFVSVHNDEMPSALHLNREASSELALDVNLEVAPLVVREWNCHLKAAGRPQRQVIGQLELGHDPLLDVAYSPQQWLQIMPPSSSRSTTL